MSAGLDTKNLDILMRLLSDGESMRVKVGILGDGNNRRDNVAKPGKKFKGGELSVQTNAEIGLKHEFGDPSHNLPVRSFLRMPLITRLQKYLDDSGAFTPAALKRVVASRSIVPWLEKVGITGETVVADAFETGGFGTWPPSNMENKTVHQTLVETQQLRNSITSAVGND